MLSRGLSSEGGRALTGVGEGTSTVPRRSYEPSRIDNMLRLVPNTSLYMYFPHLSEPYTLTVTV